MKIKILISVVVVLAVGFQSLLSKIGFLNLLEIQY